MLPFFVLKTIRPWIREFLLICALNQSLDYSNLVLDRVLEGHDTTPRILSQEFRSPHPRMTHIWQLHCVLRRQ